MPKVRSSRKVKFPKGWEVVEDTLNQLQQQMRDAENQDESGKRRDELLWPIFRLHHQRSRYIYDMYYNQHKITREVYDFALEEKYADANLIAKWKKSGYEKLCCLRCIQPKDTNFGTTCICRVPSKHLEEGKVVECTHCGCRGCASGAGD